MKKKKKKRKTFLYLLTKCYNIDSLTTIPFYWLLSLKKENESFLHNMYKFICICLCTQSNSYYMCAAADEKMR